MFNRILFFIIVSFFFLGISAAQTYELKFDSLNASGWFGGDSRIDQQRNVAVAQSVYIEQPIILESFAFYFTSAFDSASSASGIGYEAALKLYIRDSIGTIIQSEEVTVPDTFSGGWVTWSDIQLNIPAAGNYIFSTFLIGGYDSLQVNSGQGCNSDGDYANGERFTKNVVTDEDAELWEDWNPHSWDSNFWLVGSEIPTGIDNQTIPVQFSLLQNYPNPFNPVTKIKYTISSQQLTVLKIHDVLGNEIATLVNEEKSPGEYETEFNAGKLSSGIYFYRLQSGNFTATKKLILLR